MKILKQLMIILVISMTGEVLKAVIPLPVPASVYGLVLMVTALKIRLIRLEQVKDAAAVLIETMPVMFIPAAVGLMTAWGALKPIWGPTVIIILATTVLVMAATGLVTQAVIRKKKEGRKEE